MGKRLTTEEFIKRAITIHGDRYDYSKTQYNGYHNKLLIKCTQCGIDFLQTAADHLSGEGCCCNRGNNQRLTLEQWIDKANKVHNNKYDYSNIKTYLRGKQYLHPICHKLDENGVEHGPFKVRAENHIYISCGCPKCAKEQSSYLKKIPFNVFVKRARSIHGEKYQYIKDSYCGTSKMINIICPTHGVFVQNASSHLIGCGCPKCKESHLEREIENILTQNHIDFVFQQRFNWLGAQSLDFYLPQYNIAIECQGEQHFIPVDFANRGEKWSNERFTYVQNLDATKKLLCEEHNVKLLYFAKHKYNEEIITSTDMLLEKIKE